MTGGRVLIVEDGPGCRELYADWLGGEYTVEIVGTTRAGLNRVDWQSALREFFSLRARRNLLERHRSRPALGDSEKYASLVETLERRRERVLASLEEFGPQRREEIREVVAEGGSPADSQV